MNHISCFLLVNPFDRSSFRSAVLELSYHFLVLFIERRPRDNLVLHEQKPSCIGHPVSSNEISSIYRLEYPSVDLRNSRFISDLD